MNKIRKTIALYFNLSRKESNGFIILCLLMLFLIFVPSLNRAFFYEEEIVLPSDKKMLDSIVVLLETTSKKTFYNPKEKKNNYSINNYSNFNPNLSSENEMTNAGVPAFLSQRIIKFRNKGGKFKTKADLKKIYGLRESTYLELFPFIELPILHEVVERHETPYSSTKKNKQLFDLNLADSLRLVSLKGIGPTLASRILKYRNKLGGFIKKEQLNEVYGLDSFALNEIKIHCIIDTKFIPNTININNTNLTELASHPYIGRKTGQLIMNYLKQHGNYSSIEELKNLKTISEENYIKIAPYLIVE